VSEELISNDVKPIKNSFGLPTGELNGEYQPEEDELSAQELISQEEPVDEPVAVEEELPLTEDVIEEPEEDLLTLALAEEVPEVVESDTSELDKLRQDNLRMQGALDERRAMLDNDIQATEPVVEEDDDDADIDFTSKEFREKVGELLEKDPSLIPVIMQEMMDRKLKAHAKQLDRLETKAKQDTNNVQQVDRLKQNLYEGLSAAEGLGELERRIVDQVAQVRGPQDIQKSVLLMELAKNPHKAASPEAITETVMTLARKAELSARKKGLDISSLTKQPASNRSNRMLEKQKQTTEETSSDPDQEAFERMKGSIENPALKSLFS